MLLLRALLFSLFVTSILAIPVTSGTTGVDGSSVGSRLKATVKNLFPGTSNRINGYWHNKVKPGMRKKVIEIISATDPYHKEVEHDVIVLSEKLPQTAGGLILRGSEMPGFLHDFFKGEQWMRIQDAGDCTAIIMGEAPNAEMIALGKKYGEDSLKLEFPTEGLGALLVTLNGRKYEGVYVSRRQPPEVEGQPPEGHPPRVSSEVASISDTTTLGRAATPNSFV